MFGFAAAKARLYQTTRSWEQQRCGAQHLRLSPLPKQNMKTIDCRQASSKSDGGSQR